MTTSFNPNSKIIEEKIKNFFEEHNHNIDLTDALIPELSRYIALTHNHKENSRFENIIKAYDQTLGRLESKLGQHKEEFFSLMNKLVEGHSNQERFTKINKEHTPKKETPEEIILNTLKELLQDNIIVGALKQSNHDKEFKEKVNNIIDTYNNSKLDSDIAHNNKARPLPIIQAKLIELDKWCEEISKKDNSQTFKNIRKVISHSVKAVANLIIGDMPAFKKEKDNIYLYMDGIRNANTNTLKSLDKIKSAVKPHVSSSTSPSATPPQSQQQKNQMSIGR